MLNKKGQVYIISAPSGAGKTSLVKAFLEKRDDIGVCISHTTRVPRAKEIDAQDYFFINKEHFEEKISKGDFVEYAKVFDHYYGTSKSEIDKLINQGKSVILEIDWQGARQAKAILLISVLVFYSATIFIYSGRKTDCARPRCQRDYSK